MPGRRRSSFRRGDLAENLGILLMRGIAAVADVPRQEDVGVDAIATLLRRECDGNCYAEDTFVAQIKSDSEKEVHYSEHAFEWFKNQQLPMFIGRVCLQKSEIALYPTIFANQAIWSLHAKSITLRFGIPNLPPMLREQLWSPWTISSDGAEVWLGEPVVQWNIDDISNSDQMDGIYRMLKLFIPLIKLEHELLSLGECSRINWSTNDVESVESSLGFLKGSAGELATRIHKCAPALRAMSTVAFIYGDETGTKLATCLTEIAKALRERGIEIDPDKMFPSTAAGIKVKQIHTTPNLP